jgi:hypothetical protein
MGFGYGLLGTCRAFRRFLLCRRKVAIGTIFLDGSVDCVFSVSGSLSWWYDCDPPTLLSTKCTLFQYHVNIYTSTLRFSSDKSLLML